MNVLTLYFSKQRRLPAHQAIKHNGEVVGYLRVVRSTGRVTIQKALDNAVPEYEEVVLNTVESK